MAQIKAAIEIAALIDIITDFFRCVTELVTQITEEICRKLFLRVAQCHALRLQ